MTVDHTAHLAQDAAAAVAVLRTTDLSSPVPCCPGWLLRDLAGHLGGVHRWATAVVRTGERGGPQYATPPPDGELAGWLAQGAADLVAVLDDPDRPCWTFSGDGTAAFWARRQALETVVHRVDAQRAAGLPHPVDPDLAEDGIAEVLEVMLPRQVAYGRTAAPTTGATLVTGTRRHLGALPATVVVAGPAEAVLLLLWGRTAVSDPRLSVTGDAAALDAVLGLGLTP